MSFFSKPLNVVLGDPHKRELKRYQALVDEINDLEEEIAELTDAQLADKTREFRGRLGVTGVDATHGPPAAGSLATAQDEDEEIAAAEERERDEERREALDGLIPEAFAVVREASK